jgi:bacterioferritin
MKEETKITRQRMIELLNEDLAREYQAIIAYVIYSQTLKGAEYMQIAQELEKHAGEELSHALQIAKQIDYLNGEPTNKPKEVKVSEKPKEMLRFDLENERQTLINYRQRIRQAEAMGEFALSEVLRQIIAQEQEHLQDLADALGIDTPKIEE